MQVAQAADGTSDSNVGLNFSGWETVMLVTQTPRKSRLVWGMWMGLVLAMLDGALEENPGWTDGTGGIHLAEQTEMQAGGGA